MSKFRAMRYFITIFIILNIFSNFSFAESKVTYSLDTVCIKAKKGENYVYLSVVNRKDFDVTVTLSPQLENMYASKLKPLTETYPGKSETIAVRLYVTNKSDRWRYRFHFDWTRGSLYAVHDDKYIYTLPYKNGSSYKVSQSYNGKFSHFGDNQYAVDFAMPEGTPIYAARGGVVVSVKEDSTIGGPTKGYKNDSNYIVILHSDGTLGEYHHVQFDGVLVYIGQYVSAGTKIGLSGNTGHSTAPHLHFGVYKSIDGKRRISFPVRFRTVRGVVSKPVKGTYYVAD